MQHILVLQEGEDFGVPVWRFSGSRNEACYIYAPSSLGDREGEDPRSWMINPNKVRAWVRSFTKSYGTVDFGRHGKEVYALYTPTTEEDFSWVCKATAVHGGCIEIISPSELNAQQWDMLTPVWQTSRPIDYVHRTDVCGILRLPWIYLLGIYNYEPCLSLFVAEADASAEEVHELANQVVGCRELRLNDALRTEKENWDRIYRQFDAADLNDRS